LISDHHHEGSGDDGWKTGFAPAGTKIRTTVIGSLDG